jgi:hypothetical protein
VHVSTIHCVDSLAGCCCWCVHGATCMWSCMYMLCVQFVGPVMQQTVVAWLTNYIVCLDYRKVCPSIISAWSPGWLAVAQLACCGCPFLAACRTFCCSVREASCSFALTAFLSQRSFTVWLQMLAIAVTLQDQGTNCASLSAYLLPWVGSHQSVVVVLR